MWVNKTNNKKCGFILKGEKERFFKVTFLCLVERLEKRDMEQKGFVLVYIHIFLQEKMFVLYRSESL